MNVLIIFNIRYILCIIRKQHFEFHKLKINMDDSKDKEQTKDTSSKREVTPEKDNKKNQRNHVCFAVSFPWMKLTN